MPKFGEWDVNNPESAEGFTVIFNKARDDKKTNAAAGGRNVAPQKTEIVHKQNEDFQHPRKVLQDQSIVQCLCLTDIYCYVLKPFFFLFFCLDAEKVVLLRLNPDMFQILE